VPVSPDASKTPRRPVQGENLNGVNNLRQPKIRDEILEDAAVLGGKGFPAHFAQCNGGWFPVNRLTAGDFSR
jgi:hypothetical protein